MASRPETNDDLVEKLVRDGYIETEEVEEAFREVDRAEFVPEEVRGRAYEDKPLSIGEGQTVSAPHMVAMITELLGLDDGHDVLEIGTGCGYHAAVTAAVVGDQNVYTVERHDSLAEDARRNLDETGYGDVKVVVGDGSLGHGDGAPYDRIYLTCAAPEVPDALVEQLRDGGRMVLPVGKGRQTLYTVDKDGDETTKESHAGVRFVKLVGEEGF